MSDVMKSFKDKQEKDMNEIKDTMSNMMKSFEDKQENEINRIKDTVKDISQSLKNVSDLLDRTRKELGLLSIRPKRYYVSTDYFNFTQAFTHCQDKNMTLASIDSEEEYNTLNSYLKSNYVPGYGYWTSGIRNDTSSEFYWKPSGKSLRFTKWPTGYPVDTTNWNCISIWMYNNNTLMYNFPCITVYKYVCEYRE